MSKYLLKPGMITRVSGQYKTLGPRGGDLHHEVTLVKGKPAPPTARPKQTMILVDKTKH